MLLQSMSQSLYVLGAARFFVFFAIGGLEPIFLKMLSHTVKKEQRGSAFGWGASIRMFGGMFGALIGGGVIAWLGTRGVFAFGACLMFALIPLVVWVIKTVQKRNSDQ